MQKLILRKLIGAPNNLGADTLTDPIGHFEHPGSHLDFEGSDYLQRCLGSVFTGANKTPH